MGTLGALPSWRELHPLVIHFPIVLLLLAPLFVMVGAVLRRERNRAYLMSALLVMVLGTASLYLATHTGLAGAAGRELSPDVSAALLEHRFLALETRMTFTVVTGTFALLLVLTWRFDLRTRELAPVVPIAFLFFYFVGIVLLVRTAQRGGQLVHVFGL